MRKKLVWGLIPIISIHYKRLIQRAKDQYIIVAKRLHKMKSSLQKQMILYMFCFTCYSKVIACMIDILENNWSLLS